jgi:signal transduction histidine kinase
MLQGAHDIGNQLTIANGFRELAEQQLDGAFAQLSKAMQHLAKAKSADTKAQEIVRSIMAGRTRVAMFDLNAVAREAAEQVSVRAASAGVELRLELAAARLLVYGNELSIFRAILNLCLNAINAMEAVVVAQLVIKSEALGSLARVGVCDTGTGLSADALARFWDPRPETGEHGHGLAFVRNAVTEIGGLIDTESEPGEGVRVWVSFPLADSRGGSSVAAAAAAAA